MSDIGTLIFKIVVALSEMLHYATYLAIVNDSGRLRVFIGWCNFFNEICCRVSGIVAGSTNLSENVARLDDREAYCYTFSF